MKNKKVISPDYPRIAHLMGFSNLYDDDIEISFDFKGQGFCQEKVDGANSGVSWDNGPILRNRKHILKKGFMKDTPAKKQFVPMWNWLHEREDDIKNIMKKWGGQVTIYGEWLYAKHSIAYDNLPDYFLAYDVWSCEEKKFITPNKFEELFDGTNIHYIKPKLIDLNSYNDIKLILDEPSEYRSGIKEGVVVKIADENWITNTFKVVRSDFNRTETFNEDKLIKNEKRK